MYKRCVKYSHVVSSGLCFGFLNNTYIALTREEIIERENLINGIFREFFPMYKYFMKHGKHHPLSQLVYAQCGNNEKAREIVQSLNFPSVKEILECRRLKISNEVMCRIWIPACLTNNVTHHRKESPLCRQTCEMLRKDTPCYKPSKMFTEATKVISICPNFVSNLGITRVIFDLKSCEYLPWKNESVLESCQAISSSINN